MYRLSSLLIAALTFCPSLLHAESVTIAVAANFAATSKSLAADFQSRTGHKAVLTFASSGKLFAQIKQGAPFDVFLSADQTKPKTLAEEMAQQPFTYAVGRLVLWSHSPTLIDDGLPSQEVYNKLALANPRFAPYGQAALEVLQRLEADTQTRPKWVMGENINQTLQFVASGAADVGFIGLAQWIQVKERGSHWLVPDELHAPIRQDALLIHEQNEAAQAFISYLKSEPALAIISARGYLLPAEAS